MNLGNMDLDWLNYICKIDMMKFTYKIKTATLEEIYNHLQNCDSEFIYQLNFKVNIKDYSEKIYLNSLTFECWNNNILAGILCAYFNKNGEVFVTNLSVLPHYYRKNIASNLVKNCIDHAKKRQFNKICLEVDINNHKAIKLYRKYNFSSILKKESVNNKEKIKNIFMQKDIKNLTKKRDYNAELKDNIERNYAYNFDFDIMHYYMIKSFKPFFTEGNLLELGSFQGEFTKKLLPFFKDITCVEASDKAVKIAKNVVDSKAKIINALFEEVELPGQYNNIILTHVLEHLNDPVRILKKINDEWLSKNGYFFLVCPNANAPSRQIAVKMGLISHNSAVTNAERKHGHYITYTLDTLERDAKKAGLNVVHRSGIFFKALANFQWDKLLNTDIISQQYLDGCYELGQHYPDLCSSIFLLCKKG